MTAGPEITPEPANVETLPSDYDTSIVAPERPFEPLPGDPVELPIADIPVRRPTLKGRQVRTHVFWEVRTRTTVDGETETWIYRRENAARAHANRLRCQGFPVLVAKAAVGSWSVVG